MSPLYVHCAHCGFPVVVSAPQRAFARCCRQCGERFLPDRLSAKTGKTQRMYFTAAERRDALRARIRQKRRSAV